MRRQGWLLTIAAGLCNGLVPGCTHLATNAGTASPVQSAAKGADSPSAPGQASPYHPLSTTVAGHDSRGGDGPTTIKPIYYPAPVPEPSEPSVPMLPSPTIVIVAVSEILRVVQTR